MAKETKCSYKTKMKMAQALRALMLREPFEKITVSDITDECNIHRQTFYYHFQDRYELLDWLVRKELIEPFITDFNIDNFSEKINNLLETMYENKKFYQSALKIGGAELQEYIIKKTKNEFINVAQMLFEEHGDRSGIISEFIGFGLLGVIFNWAKNGMKKTPKELTEDIDMLFSLNLPY